MPDHFKLESSRGSAGACQVSRRDFLHRLGALGSVVPTSVLLPGLRETLALQGSPVSSTRKPRTGPESAADFFFTDVTARAGLSQANKVIGGVKRKGYLLDEIGIGVAVFTLAQHGR